LLRLSNDFVKGIGATVVVRTKAIVLQVSVKGVLIPRVVLYGVKIQVVAEQAVLKVMVPLCQLNSRMRLPPSYVSWYFVYPAVIDHGV
jgi:hypothetical protein